MGCSLFRCGKPVADEQQSLPPPPPPSKQELHSKIYQDVLHSKESCPFVAYNKEGKLLFFNLAALTLLGQEEHYLKNKKFSEIFLPKMHANPDQRIYKVMRAMDKIYVEIISTFTASAPNEGVTIAMFCDITQRVKRDNLGLASIKRKNARSSREKLDSDVAAAMLKSVNVNSRPQSRENKWV